MKYPEIAKRFNHILNLRDMKACELAERASMTESAISHYVHGNRAPGNLTAGILADILNVNPLWLMDLSDNMDKESLYNKLSDEQTEMLELFNSLNEDHKKFALENLKFLKAQET